MSAWTIYLLTCVSRLGTTAVALSIVSGVALLISGVTLLWAVDDAKHLVPTIQRLFKRLVVSLLGFILLTTLTPNRQEMALIVVSGWVTNNEVVSKLPEEIAKAATEFLRNQTPPAKKDKP